MVMTIWQQKRKAGECNCDRIIVWLTCVFHSNPADPSSSFTAIVNLSNPRRLSSILNLIWVISLFVILQTFQILAGGICGRCANGNLTLAMDIKMSMWSHETRHCNVSNKPTNQIAEPVLSLKDLRGGHVSLQLFPDNVDEYLIHYLSEYERGLQQAHHWFELR